MKYKENARDKHKRLALGKPHIFWSKDSGEWFWMGGNAGMAQYCNDQDARWTPRIGVKK